MKTFTPYQIYLLHKNGNPYEQIPLFTDDDLVFIHDSLCCRIDGMHEEDQLRNEFINLMDALSKHLYDTGVFEKE